MKTTELSREQMIQLKQAILNADMNEGVSYDELSRADELVRDDDVHIRFAGVRFSPEDFG